MGNMCIEVELMSARGLRRTSCLGNLQWYAVGWIDQNDKYCTKIDSSGNANPVWKTKFSALIDASESGFQDSALHVEVYSREPIFLGNKLLGTATVLLREFLDKYANNSEASRLIEEVGSFQLRKKKSNKPRGFIDIMIKISEENNEPGPNPSDYGGFKLADHSNGISLAREYGPPQSYLSPSSLPPSILPENHPPGNDQHAYPMPIHGNYYHPPIGTPPPPPLPANAVCVPTFTPRPNNMPSTYINMPSARAAPAQNARPGFGAGLGVGALAAGSLIYGNDIMSGLDMPSGLQDASLTISTDSLF